MNIVLRVIVDPVACPVIASANAALSEPSPLDGGGRNGGGTRLNPANAHDDGSFLTTAAFRH